MRIAGRNGECECKSAPLVHALIWSDSELEVEQVVRVGKGGLHRGGELEIRDICAKLARTAHNVEAEAHLSEPVEVLG